VQLRPDAYVWGVTFTVDSAFTGRTLTVVQRGDSLGFVGDQTGEINSLSEAPGEEGAMDFLRAARP
jgi:hypothetical protein